MTLTFDLLTLKVMSELRVTWTTSVSILVFQGLSVLDLCPMYATDRETDRQTSDVRQHHHFIPCLLRAGHNSVVNHSGRDTFGKTTELVQRQIFAYWTGISRGKKGRKYLWV